MEKGSTRRPQFWWYFLCSKVEIFRYFGRDFQSNIRSQRSTIELWKICFKNLVWTLQLNRANFNIQLGFWTELQSKTYLLGLDFTSGPSQFLLKVEKRSFWKILLFSFHLDFFHKASLCSNDKNCKKNLHFVQWFLIINQFHWHAISWDYK